MSRCVKQEWDVLVREKYLSLTNKEFSHKIWVSNKLTDYRLTDDGYELFCKVDIKFYEIKLFAKIWTASIVLGLARLPCPNYWLNDHIIMITDIDILTFFRFIDNVELFAKEYIH